MTVHTALLQHPSPRRVLLIGGGLAQAAREAFKHGVESIDYVQIDPAIFELEREYLNGRRGASPAGGAEPSSDLYEDDRVSVFDVDGRLFVNEARSDPYDVVIVNAPDPAMWPSARISTNAAFTLSYRVPAGFGALLTPGCCALAGLTETAVSITSVTPRPLPQGTARMAVERFIRPRHVRYRKS